MMLSPTEEIDRISLRADHLSGSSRKKNIKYADNLNIKMNRKKALWLLITGAPKIRGV